MFEKNYFMFKNLILKELPVPTDENPSYQCKTH